MPAPKYINMNRAGGRQMFALDMFTKYGIVAYRLNADGQILWIKHAVFGWLNTTNYWLLRKLEEAPWDQVIAGGYRLNAEIYGAEIGVLENSVPLGLILTSVGSAALLVAVATQDWQTAALILAGFILPFGAVLHLYLFAEAIDEYTERGPLALELPGFTIPGTDVPVTIPPGLTLPNYIAKRIEEVAPALWEIFEGIRTKIRR